MKVRLSVWLVVGILLGVPLTIFLHYCCIQHGTPGPVNQKRVISESDHSLESSDEHDAFRRGRREDAFLAINSISHSIRNGETADDIADNGETSGSRYSQVLSARQEMADFLLSETADPDLSSKTEEDVSELLSGQHYPGTVAIDTRCGSEFCRVRLSHEDATSLELFAKTAKTVGPWSKTQSFALSTSEEGVLFTEIFFPLVGFRLPVGDGLLNE
jgi:hypothetical protein